MNIIILGAGKVGATLAENLAFEKENNVTVIDRNQRVLSDLQSRLDIRTIKGEACYPNIIEDAGGRDADMLIAVTNSDETNMIGCQIAYSLFQIPTKIARIRSNSYLTYPELFQKKYVPIDVPICPEQLVTDMVANLIEYPGALQVLDFAEGRVQLLAIKTEYGDKLIGKTLKDLRADMPNIDMRVVAIFRKDRSLALLDETTIQVDDEVFMIASKQHIRAILKVMGQLDNPIQHIMIGGGGNIGTRLAKTLEKDHNVKVIDHNPENAEIIAQDLNDSLVLLGDVSDRELLIDENIEHTDVFIAVTNDDEANIMSCLQAKRLGASKVMALIMRTAYVDVIEGSEIDIAISPQQITIGSILRHMRKGDIVNVHSLRRGAAEAIEVIAHGDKKTSKVVGRKLSEIKLPSGTIIGAIARGEEIIIADKDVEIESDDHVILFMVDKKHIHDVEALFQVKFGYFQ